MKRSKTRNYDPLGCRLRRFFLAFAAIAMVSFNSSGQTTGPLDRQTPLALTPDAPAGSRIADIASVNLFNCTLNFASPLPTAGGRRDIQSALILTIERHSQFQPRCDLIITAH